MTKRIAVLLGSIGTVAVLASFAQKSEPARQLTVYDADGKKIGVIGGSASAGGLPYAPLLPFKVEGVPFMLNVYRDSFAQSSVYWESGNCSGTPFLAEWGAGISGAYDPGAMPAVAVGLPGNTVYVEDGAPRTVTIRSSSGGPFRPGSPRPPCTLWPIPFTNEMLPARPLVDMNTLYKPPFTVR